jgi:ESS family glutamate:Na+ symporter
VTFTVSQIAASLVVLAAVFAVAALIRSRVAVLRDLFLPTSVIGGGLALLIGPQVMGQITGGTSLISADVASIWAKFPGVLINVIFAALLLGKTLPSLRGMWDASSGHVTLGYGLSFGQYAVCSLITIVILVPVFGMAPEAAALMEIAFTGGHGTAAGLSGSFAAAGAPDLTDVALGLATIGLLSGVIVGSLLVRWAVRSRRFTIAREEPISRSDDRDLGHQSDYDVETETTAAAEEASIAPLTAAVMFIGLSILAGAAILEGLKAAERLLTGADAIMSLMPLFPMTIIGGMIVQYTAVRIGVARLIDRRRVNEVSGLALDVLLLTAIGTMSLAALGANLGPIIIISAAAIAWSAFGVLVLAPRLFRRRWFENAMGDYGQSQGTIATGFMLIDMADPKRTTGATESFGYKQLLFEPFVGGGFITALAIPFVHAFGPQAMLVVSTIATVAVLGFGFWLARSPVVADAATAATSIRPRMPGADDQA